MRFMMIYKPENIRDMEAGVPPTQHEMETTGKFIDELASAGVLRAADGLQQSSKGAKVRQSSGKVTITDGPFTEAKEIVGGFAILELKSKEEAIEIAKRFLAIAGDGETEIRRMHDVAAFAAS
jgi:hypothetical protein